MPKNRVTLEFERIEHIFHRIPVDVSNFDSVGRVKRVGGDHIHAHVAILLIVGLAVDRPNGALQPQLVEALHSVNIEAARLNAGIEPPLLAPLHIALPVGVAQPLAFEVGIIGADVLLRLLHGGEEDGLVGQSFLGHELRQTRKVAHVVVVDAGGPLEFDDGEHAFLHADVEILGHGADFASVGDSVTRLRVGLGLQLRQGGRGHSEVAAHTVGGLVVRNHIVAVAGDAHITFKAVVAIHIHAIAIGLNRVLHAQVATAMPHEQRFPCPGTQRGTQAQ